MTSMFKHFETKLIRAGLVENGSALFGFLDARLEWNRPDKEAARLGGLFQNLNINSLLFAQPAEPYRTIMDYLAVTEGEAIQPRDCETRTFLHDLPIAPDPDPARLMSLLKRRKGVVVPHYGIVTTGTVSIEQAYVTFSSFCFAGFVKFFGDYLRGIRHGAVTEQQKAAFEKACASLCPLEMDRAALKPGPFQSEAEVLQAMEEAGRQVVARRLVDSYFGNISCLLDSVLYISQTGSSLDQLSGCIDPCPLDDSSCAGLTASSELSAHLQIIAATGARTILHGHPPFAVILSMDCEVEDCNCAGTCHLKCPHERTVCGTPIVAGEVGTGPHGLCHTVPKVIREDSGAIVYGHGLFTIGQKDFNLPFQQMLTVENACRKEYFKRVNP